MFIWWKRLAVLMSTYLLLRLAFYCFNVNSLAPSSHTDLAMAAVFGLRFDLAMIVTLNGPLAIFHALRSFIGSAHRRRFFDQMVSIAFMVVNLPFIGAGIIDAKMYAFTGRRASPDIFSISTDIEQQAAKVLTQYWWITLLGLTLCSIVGVLSWQNNSSKTVYLKSSSLKYLSLWVLLVTASVVAARGGLQRKPLAPAHAYVLQPPALSNLALNSTITLLRSPPAQAPIRQFDFEDMNEIRRILAPAAPIGIERIALAPGKNIVIIVVESLSSEYVGFLNKGEGYTPFLDSLMERSITFSESFANGRRSIDALPAIFASVPAWRDQPYVTSPFSGNEIQALPRQLKTQGYSTAFFHGAANGSMHFDVFSAMAGIDQYIGLSEYPKSQDHDGSWGIYDEPFLSFTAERINTLKRPFFAGIFTLSSHNPFSVPKEYAGRFPKGTLPIHESIGYADFSLRQFFKKIERMPWYANTIFILTGDHTSLSERSEYKNALGHYRVPIVIHDPTSSLPFLGKMKMAQHTDIKPTVLDLLGIQPKNPTLAGWSLFDPAYQGQFIQYEYGQWLYYDRENLIRLSDANIAESFVIPDFGLQNPLRGNRVPHDKLQILKASRQYYINGLLDNSWHR